MKRIWLGIIIGLSLLFAIYTVLFTQTPILKKIPFKLPSLGQRPINSAKPSPLPTAQPVVSNDIFTVRTDSTKGSYLTDSTGKTLYIFDKDGKETSNCSGACSAVWHPYAPKSLPVLYPPSVITVFKRADGVSQFAYNGKPLYIYSGDLRPGDTSGDGVDNVWHIIKP